MTCAYCHTVFDEKTSRLACSACVVSEGCRRLRCPECGYEMPEEPAFVKRLRAWWGKRLRGSERQANRGGANGRALVLSNLRVGQQATVVGIDRSDAGRAHKLLSLGLLPGTRLSVDQCEPAFVFRVGRSQFAVDAELAGAVRVRVTTASSVWS